MITNRCAWVDVVGGIAFVFVVIEIIVLVLG